MIANAGVSPPDALTLDAGQALLLDRGNDPVAMQQAHGAIMRRIDAQHPCGSRLGIKPAVNAQIRKYF